MATSEMVKKYKIAPFFNAGTSSSPEWVRIRKSTAFDLQMNGETQDFDYIDDEIPTTELMKFKPSLSQALTMYKGEPDYEYVFDKFYNLATGSEAKTEFLLVFFQEETSGSYKAWKTDGIIVPTDLNSVDSTLSFECYFNGKVKKGTVTVTEEGTPSFTPVSA